MRPHTHLPRWALGLLLLGLLLGSCRPGAEATPTAGPATLPPAASEASPPPATSANPAATATIAGPVYDNPVYTRDFPDPHVIRVGDMYYGYSTANSGRNIPVIRSTDLARWEYVGDALLAVPGWSHPGYTWAPAVMQVGDQFVMYYTTRHAESDRQCISVATSPTPEGPFRDSSTEVFVCQLDLGGSIDPFAFQDSDGQLYLLYKNDGNCCGKPVGLWIQPLSPDGLALAGQPVELVQRDQAWERPLIEHPTMIEVDGAYYLFYSGNRWETHEYAVGYATCETVTGPCVKPRQEPILSFTPQVLGPGGQVFFEDTEGNLWVAYHAWTNATVGYPAGQRSLHIDRVSFENGEPVILGPTADPQPLP